MLKILLLFTAALGSTVLESAQVYRLKEQIKEMKMQKKQMFDQIKSLQIACSYSGLEALETQLEFEKTQRKNEAEDFFKREAQYKQKIADLESQLQSSRSSWEDIKRIPIQLNEMLPPQG